MVTNDLSSGRKLREKKLSKKREFRLKNINNNWKSKNNLSLLFKANELPRTGSLFLPSGSSDNPTPTAPEARVVTCVWTVGRTEEKKIYLARFLFIKNNCAKYSFFLFC